MNYRELRRFSRKSLHGHYLPMLGLTVLAWMAGLLRLLVPAAVLLAEERTGARLLLRLSGGTVILCLLVPLLWQTGRRLTARLGFGELPRTGVLRAAGTMLLMLLLRLLAAAPAAGAVTFCLYALRRCAAAEEGGFWLFAAVQAAAAALWSLCFYVTVCAELAAVPLWEMNHPEGGIRSAFRETHRMLRGHRLAWMRMLLRTAAGVLFLPLLPYRAAELVLYWQIRMREYQQESTFGVQGSKAPARKKHLPLWGRGWGGGS